MDPNIIVLIGLGFYVWGFFIVRKRCRKKPTKLRYIRYTPLSEAV